MFQPHFENTTATAIIEGLAVAGYDKEQSRWETTFLRNCGHYPRLTLRKVERKSGAVIKEIRKYQIQEGDSISITAAGSSETEWKFETPGEFDKKTADPQDFRWMLNIKQLSQTDVKRMNPPEIPTNLLTISNGCFYTSVLTKETYRMRWVDSQGTPSVYEELGITGKTFGADFVAKSVTIEVKGNDGFSETFDYEDDARYEMIFDNTCVGEEQPTPDGETDFYFYYRLFNPDNGRVEIFPDTAAGGGAASESLNADSGGGDIGLEGGGGEDSSAESDPEQDPKTPACQAISELPYGQIP